MSPKDVMCVPKASFLSSIFKKVEIVKVYGRSVIIIPNTSLQIRFATLNMFNSSDSYFITLTPCNKGVIIYLLRIIHLASNLISRFDDSKRQWPND